VRVKAKASNTEVFKGLEESWGRLNGVTGRAGLETETLGQELHGAGTTGEWQGLLVSPQQQDFIGPASTGTGKPEKRNPARAIPRNADLITRTYTYFAKRK